MAPERLMRRDPMNRKIQIGLSILLMGVLLCGCSKNKLTFENWSAIQIGDSHKTVEDILGEPWQATENTWLYYDKDKHIKAYIYLVDGQKVKGKTWSDPQRGIVESNQKKSGQK